LLCRAIVCVARCLTVAVGAAAVLGLKVGIVVHSQRGGTLSIGQRSLATVNVSDLAAAHRTMRLAADKLHVNKLTGYQGAIAQDTSWEAMLSAIDLHGGLQAPL
jgi:hypothetical protein